MMERGTIFSYFQTHLNVVSPSGKKKLTEAGRQLPSSMWASGWANEDRTLRTSLLMVVRKGTYPTIALIQIVKYYASSRFIKGINYGINYVMTVFSWSFTHGINYMGVS
jgi:hypothetical protein